jgi:phosphoribosylformimino-5-aminoimidazole carboxamide ribotide isomerase
MRVVPVLDVRDGVAVAAVGGQRSHYRPIASPLHAGSDPIGLARAIRRHYGFDHLYLADLDALERTAAPDQKLVLALLDDGWTVWLDPGLRSADDLATWQDCLSPPSRLHLIVALESLDGPASLGSLVGRIDPASLIFSLDLYENQVRKAPGSSWGTTDPVAIANRAFDAGIGRAIVLDVARVGRSAGPGTADLIAQIHQARPERELVAGGGINDPADLRPLAQAGASAALVGTAIHQARWPMMAPTSGTTDETDPDPVTDRD